jgi:hypothetical protein
MKVNSNDCEWFSQSIDFESEEISKLRMMLKNKEYGQISKFVFGRFKHLWFFAHFKILIMDFFLRCDE